MVALLLSLGTNTVDRDLFWGPEHALAFVRGQKATDEWLDDVWCEGGALVDLHRRELMLFGGEDIQHDVLRHRVTLAAMRVMWPAWEVRWAFEGLGDFVDHLGLSRELVRSGREAHAVHFDASIFERDWPKCVVTVRQPDGHLAIATSAVDAEQLAWAAAEIAPIVPAGRAPLVLQLRGDDATSEGVHIDVAGGASTFGRRAIGPTPFVRWSSVAPAGGWCTTEPSPKRTWRSPRGPSASRRLTSAR